MAGGGDDEAAMLYKDARTREELLKKLVAVPLAGQDRASVVSTLALLRGALGALATRHPAKAGAYKAEALLWRNGFYRCVKQLRDAVKSAERAVKAAKDADPYNVVAIHELRTRKEACMKALHEYIGESVVFYQNLIAQFRGALDAAEAAADAAAAALARASTHKSLCYLGDLLRYSAEYNVEPDAREKDWSFAEKQYRLALQLSPASGNPHNQLAVIEQSKRAECLAVYRYGRALLSAQPFATAADNLRILFVNNLKACVDMPLAAAAPDQPAAKRAKATAKANKAPAARRGGITILTKAGGGGSGGSEAEPARGKKRPDSRERGAMQKAFLQRFVR